MDGAGDQSLQETETMSTPEREQPPNQPGPGPFDQEHDPDLVVLADGTLARPVEQIQTIDEFKAKVRCLNPDELKELLIKLASDGRKPE
jgi:hypothetical protein